MDDILDFSDNDMEEELDALDSTGHDDNDSNEGGNESSNEGTTNEIPVATTTSNAAGEDDDGEANVVEQPAATTRTTLASAGEQENTATTTSTVVEDAKFKEMFYKKDKTSEATHYADIVEVKNKIAEYHQATGKRLVIRRKDGEARTFHCAKNFKSSFKAKFGPNRGGNTLILKEAKCVPFHCGAVISELPGGRSEKAFIKNNAKILAAASMVPLAKHDPSKPLDMKHAAANLQSTLLSYNQAFRVNCDSAFAELRKSFLSFQLIIPFLEQFRLNNPDSKIAYELHEDDVMIHKTFLCPQIMGEALRCVRPVVSLDAAHLKSQWKGTLYLASVKTPCDEVYP
ncbi:MAG: hypothetical protein ACKOCL_00780, partial [Candidatus Nanopelagicaceae bacterium]